MHSFWKNAICQSLERLSVYDYLYTNTRANKLVRIKKVNGKSKEKVRLDLKENTLQKKGDNTVDINIANRKTAFL